MPARSPRTLRTTPEADDDAQRPRRRTSWTSREAEQIEEEAAEEQAEDDAEVLGSREIVDAEAEDIAGETKRDGDDPDGKPGPSRSSEPACPHVALSPYAAPRRDLALLACRYERSQWPDS